MNRCLLLLILAIYALFTAGKIFSQKKTDSYSIWKESGFPPVQNFSPREYGEHFQNWWIIRDHRGIVYSANGNGILEFDGVSWRLMKTPKGTRGRSLAKDRDGTIFVGGSGDFGYLAPDSVGRMRFISLLEFVNEKDRHITEVWRTHCTTEGVYFQTYEKLFRWSNNQIKVWNAEKPHFSLSYAVRDTLYIQKRETGLFKLVGDSLQMLPGSKAVAEDPVFNLLPFGKRGILIANREKGLFLYEKNAFRPFPNQVNDFLREYSLSSATWLADSSIALSTFLGGAVIIDRQGDIIQTLNKQTGLQSDDIKQMYYDEEGMLWLPLNYGISRVKIPSPITYFTDAQGLEGNVEWITRHSGRLYAATGQGVYYLSTEHQEQPTFPKNSAVLADKITTPYFKPVNGIHFQSFYLLSTDKVLLAGTNGGIYSIEKDRAVLITPNDEISCFSLHRSRLNPDIVYAGLFDGFAVLRYRNNQWVYQGRVGGIDEEVRSIAEESDGTLWLGTIQQGILRVKISFQDKEILTAEVERFGKDIILPTGQLISIKNRILFATEKGVRSFDEKTGTLIPDSTLGLELADTTLEVFRIFKVHQGSVLIRLAERTGECWLTTPQADGRYVVDKNRLRMVPVFGTFYSSHTDADKVIWLGCNTGIIRYDPTIQQDYSVQFSPVIRCVSTVGRDSLIFGGALTNQTSLPVLPYHNNSIHFEYALPALDMAGEHEYQYYLEGFDKRWSEWTNETKKDYTNLPEGKYVFRIRAGNVYHQTSEETNFAFTILHPWYRSPWLYFIYVLLGGGLIFGLVKIRVRQLERKSHELEKIVSDRTAQIVEQRNQLKAQSEKLQELDRLKSRFFANISHEFRTPLTLVLGMIDKFINKTENRDHLSDYQVIKRNAARLLQLINQLLDLAKLEAGGISLQAVRGDIVRFVRRVILSFSSLGEQKRINLFFNDAPLTAEMGHPAIYVYFDPDKLEKVLYNLLSNAFKFTPEAGRIDVSVAVGRQNDFGSRIADLGLKDNASEIPNLKSEIVEIRISNTGPGIPEEKLPYIFDRFYQADDNSTREFEGTGIGLALVKELVELHHGEVSVQSILNGETTFTVRLPLGRTHLKDDEIAEAEEAPVEEPMANEFLSPETGVGESITEEEEHREESIDSEEETLVLVVEDHSDLRLFIREHLAGDYKIIEAENGKSGLKKATEAMPDLIISDIMMPEMDGYELCKRLKINEKTSHIPVILLTAKAATEDKLEGLETGADDYLVKPFNPEELKVRVRNLIRLRQQMREKFSAEMLLKPGGVTVPSTQKVFLEKLTAIIEEHIDDEDFSVEMLGEKIGMSRVHLHRKIRAITNQSPSEFIRSFRLQRAAELIKQDAGNIAEIAYMVGFNSQAYFTRCFQEQFGCSPSEFKRREKAL